MKPGELHRKIILIIDDEEEICILLTYALQKLGFDIKYSLTLEDGRKQLDQLQPDLVLLDLNLPDGSGFSLIPEIHKKKSKFLVISAYDDGKKQALEQGAVRFFKKPFSLEKLSSAITGIISNGKV